MDLKNSLNPSLYISLKFQTTYHIAMYILFSYAYHLYLDGFSQEFSNISTYQRILDLQVFFAKHYKGYLHHKQCK